MTTAIDNQDLYTASLRALEANRAWKEPAWLSPRRREAMERFAEFGFPSTHSEEWRYTNVAPLTAIPFELAAPGTSSGSALQSALRAEPDALRLVFVNGFYSSELSGIQSLPPGVEAGSLAQTLQKNDDSVRQHLGQHADFNDHAFVALNTALWQDGAFVHIRKGTVVGKSIHLLFLSVANGAPIVSHPRTLIVAERDTQVTVCETYLGASEGVCFSNPVTEVVAGEGAVVDRYHLQLENDRSFHIATLQAMQDRGSNFSSCSASLGGSLVRIESSVLLGGEGTECALNGLYVIGDHQHSDNRTVVDHAKPHGSSRQFYNGILGGEATGVFNGRIIVRPDAQKTDAIQKNRNLLLSENAVIDTKPQLEISANDVRCTHGATVGQLDSEALFYLQSRGIDREQAQGLLTFAFAGDVLERIRPREIRGRVEDALRLRLRHVSGANVSGA